MERHERLNVDQIRVVGRLRAPRPDVVEAIKRSIREVGLLQPIRVRIVNHLPFLVAGYHRLTAFQQLAREPGGREKYEFINCMIAQDDGRDEREWQLQELDENLARPDLTDAERSMLGAKRKAIWEELHPETRHGGRRPGAGRPASGAADAGGNSSGETRHSKNHGDGDEPADRYTKEAAASAGVSERTLRQELHREKVLGAKRLHDLMDTSLDKKGQLDALVWMVKQGFASEVDALIASARRGERVSAAARKVELMRDEEEEEHIDLLPVPDDPRDDGEGEEIAAMHRDENFWRRVDRVVAELNALLEIEDEVLIAHLREHCPKLFGR